MASKRSAGLILHRRNADGVVEVLLVHPGGPFWAGKDAHAWSIPKGEYAEGEDAETVALREFEEELGSPPPEGSRLFLGEFGPPSRKRISAWALEADFDATHTVSNTFELEWPPGSGQVREYPEVDKAAWWTIDAARTKLHKGQLPLLDALAEALGSDNATLEIHVEKDPYGPQLQGSRGRFGGAMREMTTDEALAFLAAGTRTAKVAWVASDGRPHVAPIWFIVEDGEILFNTGAGVGKARAMQRDPRISLVADVEEPPYAFVKVDGTVEISGDLDEVRRVATLCGARYMGEDQAEAFGARNGVPGECLVRLRPTSIAAFDGIADWD